MKKNRENAKERILKAAQREFADHGFGGARVDRIAAAACINKAMIFYYFQSKENLYKSIIGRALDEILPRVQQTILNSPDPEKFIETLPRIYIDFFRRNPQIVKIIGTGLIHDTQSLTSMMKDLFEAAPGAPQKMIKKNIRRWGEDGLLNESDPLHFILNIIPLCIFSILGRPLVVAILDERIDNEDRFFKDRVDSIIHLLKRGMLK